MAGPSESDLYRAIVESTPDAVIYADREGVIRLWNGGAEAVFGYNAEEVIGRSLDVIIPEGLRARHWDGFHRVMATAVTRYGRELLAVPAIRKDGTRISLEFSVALLREENGNLFGIAAILRDVTERWQRERALRQQIAELQARPGD